MVNRRTVSLVFQREVRDQFRDRRTLFMIAVLPLILYPALGLGMMQLTILPRQQTQTVVILGAENLPAEPAFLDNEHISERWFRRATDIDSQAAKDASERIRVISDAAATTEKSGGTDKSLAPERLLEQAREIRKILEKDPHDTRAGELFGRGGLQAVVVIPRDFGRRVHEVREQLSRQQGGTGVSADYPRPEIIYTKADEKSQIASSRVESAFDKWEAAILEDWLTLARIDQKITRPVKAKPVDVALPAQVDASFWSKLFPMLLIVMSVTGAFYPAVDLVAGEKERGTMETLLICPATRTEIVLGKFFTVMLFSCATALLNLASLGLTGKHILGKGLTGALATGHNLSFPPLSALVWILLILIPLSALFSALCLALATFARSSKEGQYYLTPLLMVTIGLSIFCLLPTVELTPQFSVLPVVGAALLLKGLLVAPLDAGPLYLYVVPVLVTSLGYSALALWWAVDQFQREEVLFREGERFELRAWLRQVLREKKPLPTFGMALLCFVLIMMLQFFALGWMGNSKESGAGLDASTMLQQLLVQQLAIIGLPAVCLGWLLTSSLKDTLRLHWPNGTVLAAACVLPVLIHPLSAETINALHWFFGDLPPEIIRVFAAMSDDELPLWLGLLAAAGAPAICEELAFRGFILSGLGSRGRVGLALVFSSVAFGIMHMIPQQVFNASIVGLVIGGLAVRGKSLLPCVAFHFINNALGVCQGRYGKHLPDSKTLDLFFMKAKDGLHYRWPTLVICVGLATPILVWLFRPLVATAGLDATASPNAAEKNDS
jgi:sodium transport system permease protein